MRVLISLLALLGMLVPFGPNPSHADGEPAGNFDYYVLSLSWSPTWCALEGDARNSPQCDDTKNSGWVLHGLWPQNHRGWPSYCRTTHPNPHRTQTNAMADIMGTSGLAWYQWKKHGVCSGLSAATYFALARQAYNSINRPPVFRKLTKPVHLPAALIEQAFIKENPQLSPDTFTVTCKAGHIQEARICLSKSLDPVPCGRNIIKDCTLKNAIFEPIR